MVDLSEILLYIYNPKSNPRSFRKLFVYLLSSTRRGEKSESLSKDFDMCYTVFIFRHLSYCFRWNQKAPYFPSWRKDGGEAGKRGKGSIKGLRLYVIQRKGTSLSNRIYSNTGTIPYPDASNPNVSGQTTSLALPSTCPKKEGLV